MPKVRQLLGPYLVFIASTINGYEGTGRALSLKLIEQLRQRSNPLSTQRGGDNTGAGLRTFREVSLAEPIRYAAGDSIEKWLHDVLCLEASNHIPQLSGCPHPSECELYWVDRDALFSYHSVRNLLTLTSNCILTHTTPIPFDGQHVSPAAATALTAVSQLTTRRSVSSVLPHLRLCAAIFQT